MIFPSEMKLNKDVKTKEEIVAEYRREIRNLENEIAKCTETIQVNKHNRKCFKNYIEKLKETMKLYE